MKYFQRIRLWFWALRQRRKYKRQHPPTPPLLEMVEDVVLTPELEQFLEMLYGPGTLVPTEPEQPTERVESRTVEFQEWDEGWPPAIRTD